MEIMIYPNEFEWYHKLNNIIETQVHKQCFDNNKQWGWYLNDFLSQAISSLWKIPVWTMFLVTALFLKGAKVFLLMCIICAATAGGSND